MFEMFETCMRVSPKYQMSGNGIAISRWYYSMEFSAII